MKLKEFLEREGTEKNLAELILFLASRAPAIRRGFLVAGGKAKDGGKTKNVYGEEQQPLDKYADSVFVDGIKESRLARYVATEEQETIVEVKDPKAQFGVVIDPLDGSSLIDVNLCVGTIIGIYPGHVLAKGSTMVAAMYLLYGPLTSLTYTTGKGVHEFVLDETGEFVLRQRDLKIPEGKVFAPGALRKDWLSPHTKWICQLEEDGYKLRFSGCFVADVHQILHKGGVFSYPGIKGKEKGKLRLLYEANPMGKILHEAGGAISNGKTDILGIIPSAHDDVTPIYVGGKKEIALIEKCFREG
ncbi:class 1 fructose-bisphosphatase [Methanoregula formicica]|uniref:Fructose-1,6-bisphosphatase class 1 n=1 Tax=Methanoregula formicica (strain DSM 22288 / NBRC 105244 / SMSP) TaxID=593750 RepID=L0HH58_METFS|nr:class 1 fructose-bisphosphatase [Methanoregula formicica]AGB02648.1 fructose-1,6-bisphosphatase [Methanoregula formicica SMSP]